MKGRKRWATGGLIVLVVALIGALVLTACAPSGNGGNGGNGYEPPPRPWVVRYGYQGGAMSGYLGVDPGTGASIVASQSGESLIRFDWRTHEPILYLAASQENNREEMYTDYWIREGIPFHNGDIMTAEDVKFSFDRMKDEDIVGPVTPVSWNMFINKVEVIGDYQVRVYWKNMGSPVRTVSPFQPVIVPKNYIEEVGWEDWADEPVLTGPMKVVDWERDAYVHFEKAFPEVGHWLWGDLPNYDELIIEAVPEPATRLAMLKTGELDMAYIDQPNIPDVIADPNLTLVMAEYVYPWSIVFCDYDDPDSPLSDPLVRKAVSLAIDRAGIAENVLNGAAEPWASYYSPYMLGYEYREPDPYDPEEARRLLEEAGYPDGIDTYFNYPASEAFVAQAIIASLTDVGIRAESKQYELMTWIDRYGNGQLNGISFSLHPDWTPYYPEECFYNSEFGWGGAPVNGPLMEVGEAFDELLDCETEEEMVAAAQAAEELVLDELGYRLIVFAIHWAFAYGPTIEDWDPASPFFMATYRES